MNFKIKRKNIFSNKERINKWRIIKQLEKFKSVILYFMQLNTTNLNHIKLINWCNMSKRDKKNNSNYYFL